MFKKIFFIMLLLIVTSATMLFAQGEPTPDPTVNEILGYLSPLVVLLITAIVRKWFPDTSGWIIVMLLVPGISAALAFLATVLVPGMTWLQTFLLGLLSVLLNELRKQLQQGNDSSPNYPVKT